MNLTFQGIKFCSVQAFFIVGAIRIAVLIPLWRRSTAAVSKRICVVELRSFKVSCMFLIFWGLHRSLLAPLKSVGQEG